MKYELRGMDGIDVPRNSPLVPNLDERSSLQ
jgi:hypothetical protein